MNAATIKEVIVFMALMTGTIVCAVIAITAFSLFSSSSNPWFIAFVGCVFAYLSSFCSRKIYERGYTAGLRDASEVKESWLS